MTVDFRFKRFCPHCNHDSVQRYLAHHNYDEKRRELWDGDPQTAGEPAAYFIFACHVCREVLVYHYQAMDEFDFEDLSPSNRMDSGKWLGMRTKSVTASN